MRVILRQPRREVDLEEASRVEDIFRQLELVPESYLAIRDGELLTVDMPVGPDDVVELRPVISGGRR
ncbi:MAG: thiamine biosynthesis protein ThiS [Actinomycetota bacterium]